MTDTTRNEARPKQPGHRLWNLNFLLLWQGQFVSAVGDVAYEIALGFWILAVTGSTGLMGTLMAASTIPRVLLAPIALALWSYFTQYYCVYILYFWFLALANSMVWWVDIRNRENNQKQRLLFIALLLSLVILLSVWLIIHCLPVWLILLFLAIFLFWKRKRKK